MPSIDIINNRLIIPLLGISKLYHAYRVTYAIKSVKKLPFKLFPIVDLVRLQINVPIKRISLEWTDKLFYKEAFLSSCILTSLYEVGNVLFWIVLPIKL